MNPMQMRMRARLASTMRQHTPLVLGQNGFGADIVSTASPAFIVFFDFTVLIPLAAVIAVPEKSFRFFFDDINLSHLYCSCPTWRTWPWEVCSQDQQLIEGPECCTPPILLAPRAC